VRPDFTSPKAGRPGWGSESQDHGPLSHMELNQIHTPVLLERCVELLAPALEAPGAVLIDATLGMGGHSEAFLERFPELTLVGLDRDTDALAIAGERLARFGDRVHLVHTVYDGIADALDSLGIDSVQGILFDLGVSSLQLDRAERGFAYAQDAPLDMRMNQTEGITAAEVIASYSEVELRTIFHRFGDEKLAARYAKAIVANREIEPIVRSGQLVHILTVATPAALQGAGHPAKRVFQALRIEVNQELAVLERAIPAGINALAVGGRIVVMSYQSLEDRIAKQFLVAASSSTAPVGLPVELEEHKPQLRLLTRGAELASDEEKARNPRATPVRLRAAERVRTAA
jgi:16S rRNA (cytosine1402-N4)-methyltransferase